MWLDTKHMIRLNFHYNADHSANDTLSVYFYERFHFELIVFLSNFNINFISLDQEKTYARCKILYQPRY